MSLLLLTKFWANAKYLSCVFVLWLYLVMDNTQIQKLIVDEFSEDVTLRPMSGFKMDFSANPGFRKIFFAASCVCETSALLSVEISDDKDDHEIIAAIPSLVEKLERQERAFKMMDCETHSKMMKGFSRD
tara:strand:- start:364 stop:753 length:390 start_codon:yes stop_codon:yes gene_type:complete